MSMTPIEKVLYTAKAHITGGRDGGNARTSDGHLEVKLTAPGSSAEGTNPEQLFAVGWSACYLSAVKLVAKNMKIDLPQEVSIDSEVDLGKSADGGFLLQMRMQVNLPGMQPDLAQKIIDIAHQTCPYSKATRDNINVTITANT